MKPKQTTQSLMWFRSDLRLNHNPALRNSLKNNLIKALFVATPNQWKQHHLAPIKADFIERHLNDLARQLAGYGIELEVLHCDNYTTQIKLITDYCKQNKISHVFANNELEINECRRDKQLTSLLLDNNIKLNLTEADVIISKGSLVNKEGLMYKVFSPFKKRWLSHFQDNMAYYLKDQCFPTETLGQAVSTDLLSNQHNLNINIKSISLNYPKKSSLKWPLANDYIKQHLPHFFQQKLNEYYDKRDFPAEKATSGLSPYLAIGAISPMFIMQSLTNHLFTHNSNLVNEAELGPSTWLNELIWREFYRHTLYSAPHLAMGQCFKSQYQTLPWPNIADNFKAWCEGKTGYPIIDAAMRQLTNTGWMHNRLRMLSASFLCKHLLVDWRLGERFFMQHLIDGDFAANNGGWQWTAGTGCDAQPYFRIFNPITQSKKFDPDGDFIRKYLPELSEIPTKELHFPHRYMANKGLTNIYWPAIVEHKHARSQTLEFYKLI